VWLQIKEYELIKGGSGIAVVEENKRQYVDLMVEHRLSKGSTKQTEAFVKGFKEVSLRMMCGVSNDCILV